MPVVLAALCAAVLLCAFAAGLAQTRERLARQSAAELEAALDRILDAGKPYDDLVDFMAETAHAPARGPEHIERLDTISRNAEAELKRLARPHALGAAERARRIAIRELRNTMALAGIARECAIIRAHREIQGGHSNPCFSFAGAQAVKEIEQGRKTLLAITRAPEKFATPPAPPPLLAHARPARRPNVIVILIDTLRADHALDPRFMPFLNSLAGRGAAYTNARSQAPITHQSVASLFTGLFPLTHGLISDEAHWLNELSLVREFQRAGYNTAAFSANDLVSPETGFGYGFDHFTARYWASAAVLNQSVLSWLETAEARGENFFLYIHTVDPHSHYAAPDRLEQVLSEQDPHWNLTVLPNLWRRLYIDSGTPIPAFIRQNTLKKLIRNYGDETRYADRMLMELVSRLSGMGLMDNTALVVLSDHGEAFLEHGDVEHTRSVYDEMIRVPLVFSGSVFQHGRGMAARDSAVDVIDAMPTLLHAAGLRVPSRVQGRSLLDPDTQSLNMSMTSYGFIVPSLSKGQTMIARYRGPLKTILFRDNNEIASFDLETDPGEASPLQRDAADARDAERELNSAALALERAHRAAAAQAAQIRARETRGKRAMSAQELRDSQDKNKNEMRRRLKNLGYLE